jgi:hypothetical protein
MDMLIVSGQVAFDGVEYDYSVRCEKRGEDWCPHRVTDLDGADGSPLEESLDFEAIEELALEDAWQQI